MIVVRYADDVVAGFESRADAERFLHEWKERLQKFGLELHPGKNRLIEFGRNAAVNRKQRGESKLARPSIRPPPRITYIWKEGPSGTFLQMSNQSSPGASTVQSVSLPKCAQRRVGARPTVRDRNQPNCLAHLCQAINYAGGLPTASLLGTTQEAPLTRRNRRTAETNCVAAC